MSKSTVKVVEIDTNPAVKSIKDLRKELMEYKNQMANLEEGSDAFLEVAAKAGEVKHQLDEINQQIKGSSSDFGDLVGNVTTLAAGITGAFQAVAGGLQAIGFESEALDKTIAKMQGLMAVTQGLSAIEDGKDAFKRLTKQMGEAGVLLDKLGDSVGTFIGKLGKIAAPIAIVTALGVAFVKLKEKIDGTATALKNREIAQKNFNTELEREVEIRKRAGYEEEELIKFEIDKLEIRNKQLEQTNSELKAQNDAVSQNAQAAQNAAAAFGGLVAAQAAYDGVEQSSNVNVSANTKLIKENTQEINDNTTAIANLKNQLDIIEQARKLAAQRTQDETDVVKENNLNLKAKVDSLLPTDGLDKSMTKLESIIDNIINRKDDFISACIQIQTVGNEQFEVLKNTVGLLSESSMGLSATWINSISDFQSVFNETMDIVVKKGKTGWQSYVQVASAGLQAVGSLLNNLSDEQDENTREGFEKSKKLQISSTIMNMLSGIMAAWTSSMALPAPASFITGGIQTAATAALGAAQIAKIKNTQFGSSGSYANINNSALKSTIIPPVQYSSAVQGASTQGAITNQKVYVTESDIVNTIGKVNVQESENTY